MGVASLDEVGVALADAVLTELVVLVLLLLVVVVVVVLEGETVDDVTGPIKGCQP